MYMLCVLILCFVIWKDVLGWIPRTVGEGCHRESLGGGTGFVSWCSPRECRASVPSLGVAKDNTEGTSPRVWGHGPRKLLRQPFPRGRPRGPLMERSACSGSPVVQVSLLELALGAVEFSHVLTGCLPAESVRF